MAGAGAGTTGGSSIGGMAVIANPLPIGSGEAPPFELPPWLTATWQEYQTIPFYQVCIAGWGAEQVLAVVAEYDPGLGGAEHHELFDVEPTFNNLRNQTSNSESLGKRAFLFELDTGPTAVAIVSDLELDAFSVRYLLVEQDCSVRALGDYAEAGDLEECSTRVGSPLWGIPPIPSYATCSSTTGFYGFEGQVTTDYCHRSEPNVTGVFDYRQTAEHLAELYFIEFPLAELKTSTFTLSVGGKSAYANAGAGDNPSCLPDTTTIELYGTSIRVEDTDPFCAGDQEEPCDWLMSGSVYGPLN
jgi:hypothetical protein